MLITNFRDEHRGGAQLRLGGGNIYHQLTLVRTCPPDCFCLDCEFWSVFYLVYEKKEMAKEIPTEVSVIIPSTALTELEEFVIHKGGRLLIDEQVTEQPQAAAQGTTKGQDQAQPQQIATMISTFLGNEGIPQRFFAKEILNRSQSTFSDYLTKPPQQMPKAHGRGRWLRLQKFIDSKEQQEELIKLFKRGKCFTVHKD